MPPKSTIFEKLDFFFKQPENLPSVDLIVASDVVFAASLLPGLCAVIRRLLEIGAKAAFIACTQRNGNSVQNFLQQLKKIGLTVKVEYR